MFGYVSKREHEAVVAERDTFKRNAEADKKLMAAAYRKMRHKDEEIDRLTTALAEARAKQPQRGDKGRFVGVGK